MSMLITVSKGSQITIPAELRKKYNIKVGGRVEIKESNNRIIIDPIDVDIEKLFKEARMIKPKHNMTAKEMDEYIENEILGH